MCKGLEDWLEEEKMEAQKEARRETRIEVQTENLKKLIKNGDLSPEVAMNLLEIPEDDRKFIFLYN